MFTTQSIFRAMDEVFESSHPHFLNNRAEIRSTDTGFEVDVLLPGFVKDEVKVKVEGEDLVIEAKTERKLPRYLSSSVKRTFVLEDIDCETVTASLENGLLNIKFSTSKKTAAKTITVI
jgi:HSP20 family molecular chaperone IbpA